jgi:hypothetical protein
MFNLLEMCIMNRADSVLGCCSWLAAYGTPLLVLSLWYVSRPAAGRSSQGRGVGILVLVIGSSDVRSVKFQSSKETHLRPLSRVPRLVFEVKVFSSEVFSDALLYFISLVNR